MCTPDQRSCLASPFIWDTNGTTAGQLPTQSWESSSATWSGPNPSCTPHSSCYESCVNLQSWPGYTGYQNDANCWDNFFPLCQLDVNWSGSSTGSRSADHVALMALANSCDKRTWLKWRDYKIINGFFAIFCSHFFLFNNVRIRGHNLKCACQYADQ